MKNETYWSNFSTPHPEEIKKAASIEELQARVTELENTLKLVHFELSTMPEYVPGGLYAVKASLNHIKKVIP